jgi:hypothetical protein
MSDYIPGTEGFEPITLTFRRHLKPPFTTQAESKVSWTIEQYPHYGLNQTMSKRTITCGDKEYILWHMYDHGLSGSGYFINTERNYLGYSSEAALIHALYMSRITSI